MLNEYQSSSLQQKRPSRSICLPACFSSMSTHPFDVLDNEGDYYNHRDGRRRAKTPPPRSPLPEIKGRCLNLMSMIGGGGRTGRRRHASADFHYDASSYALNFDDDTGRADDLLLRHNFPARMSTSSIPTTSHEKTIVRNPLDEILESEESDSVEEHTAVKSRAHGGFSRRRGRGRHTSKSVDFSYEPSSYARNFEDDSNRADEFSPLKGFAGRLAAPSSKVSTTPEKCSTLRPQIAAFS